eukprot:2024309-Ditylum_brightwellii.AAC.1
MVEGILDGKTEAEGLELGMALGTDDGCEEGAHWLRSTSAWSSSSSCTRAAQVGPSGGGLSAQRAQLSAS